VGGKERLHIVYVAGRMPYPPLWGGALRVYHQLRLLARQHRVTLIVRENPETSAQDLQLLREMVDELIVVRCPKDLAWLRYVAAASVRKPLQLPWFYHPALGKAVRDVVARGNVDLIHVHTLRVADAVEGIPGVPKVLDLVDALSMNIRRRGELQAGWMGLLGRFESNRLQQYEQARIAAFDVSMVSSPVDLAALGDSPDVDLVGNGVEVSPIPPREEWLQSRSRNIVFLGRMSYFPNRDAVKFFMREIFPLVRESAPEAKFVIVGSNPTRDIAQLGRMPGVTVTGTVADVRQRVANAAVVVCPMRCGSGVSNKILEAAALARPIVSTPLAMEGLAQLSPGIAIAQKAAEFASRVVGLLNDGAVAYQLGSKAAELAAQHYSLGNVLTALEQTYDKAIVRSRGGRTRPGAPGASGLAGHRGDALGKNYHSGYR
jgi:sugar transferase (PEP-CTERM/EpsH1 system associated)